MNDPLILSATLKHYGPELSTLGGEQIELTLYVVYDDGTDGRITVYGANMPEFVKNLRKLDMNKKQEAIHG